MEGTRRLPACERWVSGCASKWAEQNAWKRTPKGFVRMGGNNFPLVPMVVDVKLLDRYGNFR
jgi:hypothetical protein